MLGHRELTMEDYADIFRRRLWLILACVFGCLGLAVAASFVIPARYMSQTLVLIEQQQVPTEYVTPVITEDLGERLASMKEQILSRSALEPIIQRFNLFAGNKTLFLGLLNGGQATMDDRIAMTQKAIGVKPIPATTGSHGMPGFFITFTGNDPRTAQQVCGEITSLFMNENLSARQQSAEGTTEFLKQQLANAKESLDEQDAKLADFERKYIGKLPDQESSNETTLHALATQLDAVNQSLDRLQQNETILQAMVNQQTQDSHTGTASVATPSKVDLRKQLQDLIEQRQKLETIYTPDYPDVVEISRNIADLQAQLAAPASSQSPSTAAPALPDPPELVQQKAQLKGVQQSILTTKREQADIEKQIRDYEARIDMSPLVEEQYKQITRDHDTALQFYNSLLKKMDESSMATALEQRQEGEQFRVMDAPNLPDSPDFPKRPLFAAGGLLGGLMLALILCAILEYRDNTLRSEADIWAFTKLPTLALLPHLPTVPGSDDDRKHNDKDLSSAVEAEKADA